MSTQKRYCPGCAKYISPEAPSQHCPDCGGAYFMSYDYAEIKESVQKEDLKNRSNSIWRYHELLPVSEEENIISLNEGGSPIELLSNLSSHLKMPGTYLKDESAQPFGGLRAREASVIVSHAAEQGYSTIIAHTNIYDGQALAFYCAKAQLKCILVIQGTLPGVVHAINQTGATVYTYSCHTADAAMMVERSAKANKWYNASTFFDSITIEGKKTIAFEIAESFDWKLPEVIIMPTGRSGCFASVYKGIRDLQQLGWIDKKLPHLVLVEVDENGKGEITTAWQERRKSAVAPSAAGEFGFSGEKILFTKQLDHIVLDGIYKSVGCAISVTPQEVESAQQIFASHEGTPASFIGGAGLAAAAKLSTAGWIHSYERTVIINPCSRDTDAEQLIPENSIAHYLDITPELILR